MVAFHEDAEEARVLVAAAHGEHAPVEMALDVAVFPMGGSKGRELPQRLTPAMGSSVGVDPGKTPVEHGADRLLVALAEAGDECAVCRLRRLLVVDRGRAAENERAPGETGEGQGCDHEAAHANCSNKVDFCSV